MVLIATLPYYDDRGGLIPEMIEHLFKYFVMWIVVLLLLGGCSKNGSPSKDGDTGKTKKLPSIERLTAQLNSNKRSILIEAAKNIGLHGPKAKELAPVLIKKFTTKDPGLRGAYSRAVAEMGPEVVPLLTEALESENPFVRQGAAYALGEMGPAAKEAVPALIKMFRDQPEYVTDVSAKSLAKIGEAALSHLEKALESDKMPRRYFSALTLIEMGKEGKSLVPALIKRLSDKNSKVIFLSVKALGKMGDHAKVAVPELARVIFTGDKVLSKLAFDVMSQHPVLAKEELVKGLKGKVEERRIVAKLVQDNVALAESLLPQLIEVLDDPDEQVRRGAVVAIKNLGKKGAPALPSLIERIEKDKTFAVPYQAIFAVGKIGLPEARKALPVLWKVLNRKKGDHKAPVIETLVTLGEGIRPWVEEKMKTASDDVKKHLKAVVMGLDRKK